MLKKSSRKLLFQAIAANLEKCFLGSGMEAGSFLPTEDSLGKHYKVSRKTVRNALQALQTRGLIEPRRPLGWALCSPNSKLWRVGIYTTERNNLQPWLASFSDYGQQRTASVSLQILRSWTELESLDPGTVDSAILYSGGHPDLDLLRRVAARGIALVGCCIPGSPLMDTTAEDIEGAMEQAVGALVARGHRRLLYIGWETPRDTSFARRHQAFFQICRSHGLAGVNLRLSENVILPDDVPAIEKALHEQDSDAVLLGNGAYSAAFAHVCHRLNLSVPKDLSLLAFDSLGQETPTGAGYSRLVRVRQDIPAAVVFLLNRLQSRRSGDRSAPVYQRAGSWIDTGDSVMTRQPNHA